MNNKRHLWFIVHLSSFIVVTGALLAQQQSPPSHDITMVDKVPLGGAISTPLPEAERKKLEKYDLPELTGSTQALGSQLIAGALPQPLIDYIIQQSTMQQRLSIFEGGLV